MNAEDLFWELAAELQAEDPRVVEGTIMSGRCLGLAKNFWPWWITRAPALL